MPLTFHFVFYLALAVLSIFTLVGLLSGLDAVSIGERLRGQVPERLAGGVLAEFGALFFLHSAGQIFVVIFNQAAPSAPELGKLMADLLTCPVWVLGGVLLWCRQAFGYVSGAGLLFQVSMLFIGLLAFFYLAALPERSTLRFGRFYGDFGHGAGLFHPLWAVCAWHINARIGTLKNVASGLIN